MAHSTGRWLLAVIAIASVRADEGIEFFEKRVRPVLAAKCYVCHSARTTASGGLRVDTRDAIRKGGQHGPAVVAGRPDTSLLVRAISYEDASLRMPPTGALSPQQIADLTRWIEMGAPDPREEAANAPGAAPKDPTGGWWAFQPFREHAVPKVRRTQWAKTWIDPYLLAAMEAQGLSPALPAARRILLRRVTYDLTGLPPSPAETAAFLADQSPRAFENVVDRLLASPRYGERWARHWLDLARYAETDGHEFDREKPNAWRYRDYVIRALNDDLPFDQFIREQIAGDLLDKPRLSPGGEHFESPVGTTFLALHEERNAADDLSEVRAEKIDNQIDTVSKTFLGLTVACARCHDHKFDPIPTRDYYAMAGVLHSKNMIQGAIDGPKWIEQTARVVEAIQGIDAEIAGLLGVQPAAGGGALREGDVLIADLSRGVPEGWRVEGPAYAKPWAWQPPSELTGFLYSRSFRADKKFLHVRLSGASDSTSARQPGLNRVSLVGDGRDIAITPDASGKFTWKTTGLGRMFNEVAYIEVCDRTRSGRLVVDKIVLSDHREPPKEFVTLPDPVAAPAVPEAALADLLARREALAASIPQPAYGLVGTDDVAQDVRVHIKGDHRNLGDWVPRGFLRALAAERPFRQGSGRLELAEALASPGNPLTARVIVNRVWKHHFGEGLVRTVDNFGRTGEPPSHPELLDTMAARFVRDGWSLKKLHRAIVLSAAYRMSSTPSAKARETDPDNRLLSFMRVRRLEGEAIRDAILSVSGALDRTMYGPSVMPHISDYQDGRGKPGAGGPIDGNGRRSIYIGIRRNFLPPLFVAFDYPMTVTAIGRRGVSTVPSQALMLMNNEFVSKQASRWADAVQSTGTDGARVRRMFEAAYSRPATAAEAARSLQFVASQKRHYTGPDATFRAWADLAHALFNSKEFIFIR